MKKQKKLLSFILTYIMITLASAVYSLGFCWLYQPNGISVGGFTGIAQILNHLFPVLPIGVVTIVLNIPLFIIAMKMQGIKLFVNSLYCMVVCSVFVDVFPKIITFKPMNDLLLASIFGGVVVGISCGLLMKVSATNGGSELAARLLKYKFHHISVGKLCLYVDLAVIVCFAITFKKLESALYGVVSMYVLSLVVDFVVYGGTHAKMAHIISDKSEEIRKKLLDMNLGVTMVQCRGGWRENDNRMIICAFRPQQIAAIKAAVAGIDPSAFVIVCDAHEVLGEGFRTYSPDEL